MTQRAFSGYNSFPQYTQGRQGIGYSDHWTTG